MKNLLLTFLLLTLVSCGSGSGNSDANNPNDPNNPNNPNDNNGTTIGTNSLVIDANGTEIGTFLEGNGYSYTFKNSGGYIGTINTITGYLNYGLQPQYTTANCTGQAYAVNAWQNYPISTYAVYRGYRDTSKMYHATTNTQTQISPLSYWSNPVGGACNATNGTAWAQPMDEILEATSGIKLIYDTPITIEEQ